MPAETSPLLQLQQQQSQHHHHPAAARTTTTTSSKQQQEEQQDDISTDGNAPNNNNPYSHRHSHSHNSSHSHSSSSNNLHRARQILYLSHLLSQFSEISWQFCIILFLAAISNYASLLLVSTYGLTSGLVVAVFSGGLVGRCIDGVGNTNDNNYNNDGSGNCNTAPAAATTRLKVVQRFIACQNLSVLGATVACYWILKRQHETTTTTTTTSVVDNNNSSIGTAANNNDNDGNERGSPLPTWMATRLAGVPTDGASVFLLVVIHVLGSMADALDAGFTVAMERDWVVVMAGIAMGRQQQHEKHGKTLEEQNQHEQNQHCHDTGVEIKKTPQKNNWLSETNVTMRQIDLSCKVLAPAVAGIFIAAYGGNNTAATGSSNGSTSAAANNNNNDLEGAALLVGALNLMSLVVQYASTYCIYGMIPELSLKCNNDNNNNNSNNNNSLIGGGAASLQEEVVVAAAEGGVALIERTNYHHQTCSSSSSILSSNVNANDGSNGWENDDVVNKEGRCCSNGQEQLSLSKGVRSSSSSSSMQEEYQNCNMFSGIRIYFRQSISWGGISLALLYFNALTFGAFMTAYLAWEGMSLSTIGIWRGVSAGIGLLGTFSYHSSVKHSSLAFTGLWSIASQFICLSCSYASFFVAQKKGQEEEEQQQQQHEVLSLVMLIGGVCFSRIGLYVFDLTITQYMQSCIPERHRGTVGGVQKSIESMFQFGMFVLGWVFPDPNDFLWLVVGGYASVGVALVVYAFGVYARRDTFPVH